MTHAGDQSEFVCSDGESTQSGGIVATCTLGQPLGLFDPFRSVRGVQGQVANTRPTVVDAKVNPLINTDCGPLAVFMVSLLFVCAVALLTRTTACKKSNSSPRVNGNP